MRSLPSPALNSLRFDPSGLPARADRYRVVEAPQPNRFRSEAEGLPEPYKWAKKVAAMAAWNWTGSRQDDSLLKARLRFSPATAAILNPRIAR